MTTNTTSRLRPSLRLAGAAMLALATAGCGILGGSDKPKTPTVGERIPVLSRIESGAVADPSLASVSVILPPAAANREFAQPSGGASNAYGHLAIGANPAPAWTAQIAGSTNKARLASSPVIGGGRLFVFDTAGTVHAFDATSGAPVWRKRFNVSGDGEGAEFGGGVSYNAGRVYLTTGVGEVAALDANTGDEVWRVKPSGPLRGAPTLAFDTVFVMTQNNEIYALDIGDGAVQWFESGAVGQAGVFGVAAPAAAQGTVIAGYSSGELAAYRYENGRQLWGDALARTSVSTSVGTITDIDADPIIDQGRVYALGQGGRMAAYELVTGQRIWELNLGGISTPAVAGEWIFTLTSDSQLLAIQRSSGKVKWVVDLPAFRNMEDEKDPIFWTGPVLAGDRLWMANSEGQVAYASVNDGSLAYLTDLDPKVSLPPIVANNTLYVLDDGGTIRAYR
ncbi:MAG: pyrrolo-quinoline quinone [Sphingomonadales bacterium CG12_big_fil_rev_8_21_14_0_65_65_10]|nr:PQQ-like beta-propeller repeat protein [Blastomonas marina]PIW54281.1 MAG: pyrrolo-quinoline quinone [Sphingomonadales bacterium CG12_big_fil_rev_8_21_14_0_65_65_10]WPZ04252.1 PQQ-binding-like beta-propeller repeat protein [Blastomonas marina]